MSAEAQSLASSIIDILENRQKRFLGFFKKRLNAQTSQAILTASTGYIRKFRERHGKLKILGMNKPVSLDSVYVPIHFLENSEINKSISIDDMEKARRDRKSYRLKSKSAQKTAIAVANQVQYLSIIGSPGAGKTTLLRKIGLEALKPKTETEFQHICIPLWVDLKKFSESAIDFQSFLVNELEYFDFPESLEITESSLKQGRFLILFDGLDEVSSQSRDKILNEIDRLVEHYDKNRYVLSCRAAAYRSPSARFSEITLAGNSKEQIKNFIYNWFAADDKGGTDVAEGCWKLLQKPDNAAVRELAQTPLLLTFLCLVYSRSLTFSVNRSILYHEGLRILLKTWSEEKRSQKEKVYERLHLELEEKLLAGIAYDAFKEDKLLFSKNGLVKHIRGFLLKELNAPNNLSGENVLNAIAIQQGILVEQSEGIYAFSHLTFQEFLTAKYIHENYSNQELSELVKLYANDRRWEEVFLLVAGLKYDESNVVNLLIHLNQVAQRYINTPNLRALWLWATQVTSGLSSQENLIEQRANVLYRAFHYGRLLSNDPVLKGELETTQFFLQPFIYNLRSSNDLTITTHLINALHNAIIQIEKTNRISDLASKKSIEIELKKAIKLAKPLAKTIRRRASVRSLQYLKNREQNTSLEDDLRRNEIFAGSDFVSVFEQLNQLSLNIPEPEYPIYTHKKFLDDLKQVCLRTLKLDETWLMMSQAEVKACQDCLYVTLLMLKCRKEAKRISPQRWDPVENQILSLHVGGGQPAIVAVNSFFNQIEAVSKQEDDTTLIVTEFPNHLGLTTPFLVSVTSDWPTEEDIDSLFHKSVEIQTSKPGLTSILFYREPPGKLVRERLTDLRLNHGFTIISIALAEIENVLPNSEQCEALLFKYIRRYVDNLDFFDDKYAISDKLLFFGRSSLLKQIEANLKRHRSIGLFGLRKSGKTSILLQLRLNYQENPTIQIDLQKYSDSGYGIELFDEILQSLYALVQSKNPLSEPPSILSEHSDRIQEASHEFYKSFKRLAKDLAGVGYELPILCCLDDIGRVFPRSNEKSREKAEEFNAVFGALRTLNQKEQLVSLLVTDVQPQCNRTNQWNFPNIPNNPCHQFFKEVFLKPFFIHETSVMLNGLGGLMNWEFDHQTIRAIHRLSGGQPFLSRKLASFIVKKAGKQTRLTEKGKIPFSYTQPHLRKVFRDQSLKAYVLHGIIGELKTYNSKLKVHYVLNALSLMTAASNKTDGWIRARGLLSFVSNKLNLSEIQCLDAVHVLQNLGIVEHKEHPDGYDCYRIRVVLLHQWFQMLKKSKKSA